MSCAISYYLGFVFPGGRLLAVELTSSNTKPVVQEFQSECSGARWLPKQLRKILLIAHGIWFLGVGRTNESSRFRKALKNMSVSFPV